MKLSKLEKIDLEVAKGLGWTKLTRDKLSYKETNLQFLNRKRWQGVAPGNWRNQFIPHYSINIAYAWDIVTWCEKNWAVFEYATARRGVIGGHYVTIGYCKSPFDSFHTFVEGEGTSAPLAICDAFIKLRKVWNGREECLII